MTMGTDPDNTGKNGPKFSIEVPPPIPDKTKAKGHKSTGLGQKEKTESISESQSASRKAAPQPIPAKSEDNATGQLSPVRRKGSTVRIYPMEEVVFELEQRDLDAFDSYIEKGSSGAHPQMLYIHLVYAGIGLVFGIVVRSGIRVRIGVFFGVWILFAILVPLIIWLAKCLVSLSRKPTKLPPGVLCEHHLKIAGEGVFETTPFDSSRFNWSVVTKIEVEPGYIFISVPPTGTHIIPRRAFENELHEKKFVCLAQKYFEASHG